MPEPQLVSETFFPCDVPRLMLAPPTAIGNRGWRDSLNVGSYDGALRRRPAVIANANTGPSISLTSAVEYELPLIILHSYSPTNVTPAGVSNAPCANTYPLSFSAKFCVLVTSRRIWIYSEAFGSGVWTDWTPQYTTGTLTATNGLDTITGAGTAWLTDGISPYQHILIDGTWYKICVVTSNTAMTLTSNFTGATAAGKAYQIRRNWDLAPDGVLTEGCNISATIYNQNLYVAGTYVGRADGQRAPAVIRVSDILAAAPATAYLTAKTALTPGLDTIADLDSITGIQCLQDGRVVISGNESTIFYSSHLDQTVWTVAPGGNTPVSFVQGGIHALGRLHNALTLHYEAGIVLAEPTGLADPPLAYRNTNARNGCFAPRTLRSTAGAEYYVTADANVGIFNGAESRIIGDDVRETLIAELLTTPDREDVRLYFSGYEPNRGEYQVYRVAAAPQTNLFTLRLADGSWWVHRLMGQFTAAGDGNPFGDVAQTQLLGASSVSGAAAERSVLYTFSENAWVDAVTGESPASQTGIYVETDDLDFGLPLSLKELKRVVVWVKTIRRGVSNPTYGQDLTVSVSNDAGGSYVSKTVAVSASTGAKPISFWFVGALAAQHLWRVRVQTAEADRLYYAIVRLFIEAKVHGDIAQHGMT
jgi:hypothetical protein